MQRQLMFPFVSPSEFQRNNAGRVVLRVESEGTRGLLLTLRRLQTLSNILPSCLLIGFEAIVTA